MTKNVLITVQGMQINLNGSDNVEVTTVGTYYYKNGKHYIYYEEILDCTEPPIKNWIKIYDQKVEVCKRGASNVQMFFETGKKSTSLYKTPFGTIEIGICAQEIEFHETEEKMKLELRYDLEMNGEYVGDSFIYMTVEAKQ
ncbi:MAG TPA: DUF1934 domain-containing protein [Candidatus Fimimorpha faecalis]|uniref:DUF1934 domain-containing protein n=1 Tax=Candidatus Fimimorpha faecalis TaxID=2840824 RepID=A0A9D1ECM6_9FIRM|nr:DUF1934 domain-containing protein [Candidatus Fimimorpha faecalis]